MTAVESTNTIKNAESPEIDSRDVVSALRLSVLQLIPSDIGWDPRSPSSATRSVWGLVIETAHSDAVASLVTLADGSVSLYVSDGTGCIGCGLHRDVRFAGADLLEIAQRTLGLTAPAGDIAYPPVGHIRFYFLAGDGLRSVQVRMDNLNSADPHLHSLYFAGQRVINVIERVGAGQSVNQEVLSAELAAHPSNYSLSTHSSSTHSSSTKGSTCLSAGNAVRRLPR